MRFIALCLASALGVVLPGTIFAGADSLPQEGTEAAERLSVAREHRLAGQTDQALLELRSLLIDIEGDPKSAEVKGSASREMGEIYMSRNELKKAIPCLEQAVSFDSADSVGQYDLGLAYRELGDNRRAAMHLQAAVDRGFNNLGANFNLVHAYFDSRQSTRGLETARRVISRKPRSPALLMKIGILLFDHLFYEEALRAFALAQQQAPEAYEPRFRRSLTCYLLGQYETSVETLDDERLLRSSPEAASLFASAQAKLGRFDLAVALLKKVADDHPESPHAYINLSLIYLDRGSVPDAENALQHLRSFKSKQDTKVFYTVARNSCPDFAAEVQENTRRHHLPSEDGEFYYQMAKQLQEKFNYLSAVELSRLAYDAEGPSARVLYLAGVGCLNHDPAAPEPLVFLQQAIAIDPSFHQAHFLLGRAYARQGNLDGAISEFRTATALHADSSYFVSLGKSLVSQVSAQQSTPQKNQGEAVAAFERAVSLDSSNAQAHLELGRLLVKLGRFAQARRELEKSLELEPDLYEADYLLGQLLHRMGDQDGSRTHLAQFGEKKNVLLEQSVIGSGFVGDGH